MNQTQVVRSAVGGVAIRRAGACDVDGVTQLLAGLSDLALYFRFQVGVGRPPRRSVVEPMLSPSGAAWVAEREGAVVGHVMWAWVEGSALPTAELAVVVAEAEQRRRLGLRMMNLAAEDAYAAGAVQLLLVVSAANDPVIRMIRSHVPGTRVERDGPNLNFFAPATRLAADELQV